MKTLLIVPILIHLRKMPFRPAGQSVQGNEGRKMVKKGHAATEVMKGRTTSALHPV
ncbi:hypothetical protein [Rossellomorea marisflavi]|uniref:hypothetical protein n=1 Tax=Rossellomorea marisflavi TaxID=189381 RepID=UPI001364BB1D|nr:hypothetical protein [Rossellomorea marisflavi]